MSEAADPDDDKYTPLSRRLDEAGGASRWSGRSGQPPGGTAQGQSGSESQTWSRSPAGA